MKIFDEVQEGDSYTYVIDKKNPFTPVLMSELNSRIRKMRNFIGEWICIVLESDEKKEDRTIVNFIQFSKGREAGKTRFYDVEIQITRGDDETQKLNRRKQYAAFVGRKELLKLLEDVCLRKELPDFSGWKDITDALFADVPKKENREQAEIICSDYYTGKIKGKNAEELHYESEKISEQYAYGCEFPLLAGLFETYGQYEKIKRLYEAHPLNPWLQKRRGDIEYYGYLGSPNYRKAFEFYKLAAKCGNLKAKFQLGQMYKYGYFVEKNFDQYEKITKEVFSAFNDHNAYLLPLIDYVVLELSYIEQEKGNPEKSLEYALLAKNVTTEILPYDGVTVSDTSVEIIQHLRSLTGLDGSDLDLLDLTVLLQTPCTVRLKIDKQEFTVKSFHWKRKLIVEFQGKFFNGVTDFIKNAKLCGKTLTTYFEKTDSVEVIK